MTTKIEYFEIKSVHRLMTLKKNNEIKVLCAGFRRGIFALEKIFYVNLGTMINILDFEIQN